METEVICISSDDESDSQKENKTDKFSAKSTETSNVVLGHGKTEISDNEKVEEKNLKRKISKKKEITCNAEKKRKLNVDHDTSKTINKLGLCSVNIPNIHRVKSNCNAQPSKDQERIEKTQLVVKEKKKISYILQDVFPLFISLCMQKCPKGDKIEMDIIVDKLKRRYENLDPTYAISSDFVMLLNKKRDAILSNDKKIYVHIEEVMNEMKKRTKKNSQASQINEIRDAVPSTSYATNNVPINKTESGNADDDNEDEENTNFNEDEEDTNLKTRRKVKQVLRAMRQCETIIKKLEEEEVDFTEENDSNYIKVERYKRKMVELYTKLCELTGESADAGRVYLRPKHLNVTRIVTVDQAITNFINYKITRRNRKKKTGTLTDDLIFPDYKDILECVNRCNNNKNLGLDEDRQKQMAEKAFKELGAHLQRTRRNDYWDTFSLYLENTEDPATKDTNLARKLAENRIEGEKRLTAVFEKYTRKQAELKEQDNEGTISEEQEDEEEEEEEEEGKEEEEVDVEVESIIDGEDKNEDSLSVISEGSENEKNIDKTVNENILPIEKKKPNINMNHAMDEAVSVKTITDTLSEKGNKTDKINVEKESNTTVSKNENKTISQKIVLKPCNSNTILRNVKNAVTTETEEDSVPAASTTNCTKELAEAKNVSKVITDPATKEVTKDVADTVTNMENAAEIVTKNVTDEAIESMSNDEQLEEEKKPLLRVRSFAKHPMTWEDNQHKANNTAQENAPKVTNQTKEIVDLTNEGTAKPSPVVAKCTILDNKVIPVKRQTVFIPNIISVKNVTNNYLKVNTRTGQIIAPVHELPNIRAGTTIIRLPSIQTTNRESQPQNANVLTSETLKGKTILKLIPTKSVILSKTPVVQSISKQTDVSSTQSK